MTTSPPTLAVEDLPDSSRPPVSRALLVTGVALAAVVTVYLALVAATGDGLPRGTRVLGIDVGGQSEAQAAVTLERELGPRATAPLDAVVGTDHVAVVPSDAGLSFDAAATVAGLSGRVWNPATLVASFTGGPRVAPVILVDRTTLARTVESIAADSDRPAREPTIVVRGTTVELAPGRDGTVLDRAAAAEALSSAYVASSGPVVLPLVDAVPTVSDGAARQALATARSAVSGPVSVTVGPVTARIPAATVAEALHVTAKDGRLVLSLDGAVLRAAIAPALAGIETPGRDATWDVSSGRPRVVPAVVGRGVNADLLAADVLAVLDESGPGRTVAAQIGAIDPELTTAQARALGVVERLSSFTQRFPYAAYRVQNIGQAAERVNGTLLLPGQTFSLNDTILERTPSNGYTVGYVVGPGGVFKEDLGGGVSTSATTIWTAAFYAGLERVSTRAHSIWIPRYRAGLEATVAWGAFDMKFRNDTPHGVYITTVMRNTSLTVSMWGTRVYSDVKAVSGPRTGVTPFPTVYDATPTCHAQGGEPGFSIDVHRVFLKAGKEVRREKITTRYRPGPHVVCGADPSKATPSPSPSPSPGTSKPASPGTSKPATPTAPTPAAT